MKLSLGPPYTTRGQLGGGMIFFELLNENYMTTIHIAQIGAHTQKRLK
jgi:hypothetical protein